MITFETITITQQIIESKILLKSPATSMQDQIMVNNLLADLSFLNAKIKKLTDNPLSGLTAEEEEELQEVVNDHNDCQIGHPSVQLSIRTLQNLQQFIVTN